MERFYIQTVHIQKVRHLENLDIMITPNPKEMRHLILTGKNGSGKTSLLEAMRTYLNSATTTKDPYDAEKSLNTEYQNLKYQKERNADVNAIHDTESELNDMKKE